MPELQRWNWGLLCCRCYCRCYQRTKHLYPQEGRERGVGGCAGGKDTTTRARVSVQGNPSSRHNTTTTSVCSVVSSWDREGHCFSRPVNHSGYIRATLAGTGKDTVCFLRPVDHGGYIRATLAGTGKDTVCFLGPVNHGGYIRTTLGQDARSHSSGAE